MQKQVESLEAQKEHFQETNMELKKQLDAVGEQNRQFVKDRTDIWNKFREAEERADAAEQEIVRLKAKLYDFMCQE